MKKFKLLKFGRCYINREGDLAVALLRGDKKHGYQLAASSAHPNAFLGKIQLLSRVVPNDGNWIEIDSALFNVASAFHCSGHVVTLPTDDSDGECPVISKNY
jgi:hypothetical protein